MTADERAQDDDGRRMAMSDGTVGERILTGKDEMRLMGRGSRHRAKNALPISKSFVLGSNFARLVAHTNWGYPYNFFPRPIHGAQNTGGAD